MYKLASVSSLLDGLCNFCVVGIFIKLLRLFEVVVVVVIRSVSLLGDVEEDDELDVELEDMEPHSTLMSFPPSYCYYYYYYYYWYASWLAGRRWLVVH